MSRLLLLTLLAALSTQAAPPTLTTDHRAALATELRHQGIALGDLATADRSVDEVDDALLAGVLTDPLTALDVAQGLANPVAMDAAATAEARWEGAFGLVADAWGVKPSVPACGEVAAGAPLSSQHVLAAEARGERWSRRAKNDIAQRLDDDLDAILGQLADAAAEAACGVEAAFAEVTLDDAARAQLLGHVAALLADRGDAEPVAELVGLPVRWGVLLETSRRWTAAIDASAQRLAGLAPEAWPTSPLIWSIGLGEVWIGSPGANSGAGNPVLLVDPGGDDHWRIRAEQAVDEGASPPVRGWIDLGGDDVWRGGTFGAGAAAFGVAAGLDLAGDDTHIASAFAAGAAVLGVATWLDAAGRDRYEVRAAGLGFGMAGAGILRDLRRDDVYRSDRWAQGASLPGGVGLLHDLRGGDRYLLNDDLAEERESASLPDCHAGCGQGFAAGLPDIVRPSRALLLDDGGDDVYSGGDRVQGSAWLRGVAVVRDGGGDDRWLAGAHAQAAAEDQAVAALLDFDGFDEYSASWRGQGAAGGDAVAWLYDRRGRDRYSLGSGPGQGAGYGARGVGVVLDPDGGVFNLYSRGGQAARHPAVGVTVGAGTPASVVTGSKAPKPRLSVDQLVAALEATDGVDVDSLGNELTSPLRRLNQTERARVVGAVVSSARRLRDTEAPRHHLDWLVTLTARAPLLVGEVEGVAKEFTSHRSWRVREAAWNARAALGRIEGLALAPEDAAALATAAAVALQKEAHQDVRAAAARAAGAFGEAGVASSLVDGLLTDHLALRRSAERALLAVAARTDGVAIARGLYGVAGGDEPVDPVLRDAALRVLGATKQREAVAILEAALSGDDATALAAAEGLLRHGSRAALAAVAPWRAAHPDKESWAGGLLGE